MDFSFSDDQLEIQALARRILEDKATPDRLAEIEAGDVRFDPDLWRALADANLLGIGLPEADGGSGLGVIEQCLVLQEVGRTVAPVPVLPSTISAAAIAQFGTTEQRATWVAPAADGQAVLAAALPEPHNRDAAQPATTAAEDSDGWRLRGIKTAVPAATLADALLVPAAVEGDGVAVFIVEAAHATITPQHTTNRDTHGYVELDGAPGELMGTVEHGRDITQWLVERMTIGLCAMQLGVCEKALHETAEYTKQRVQFDRPIATFQAVGQRCADAYIDVEGIRMTLWQAAWRLADGLPASVEVEVAKFWAAEGGHRVAHAAVHLHGGMGVATEHTIHRYFIHAKQIEFALGGATEQALRIGAALAAEPA